MTGRMVREVWEYRELLLALVARDIRVKYKQAVMGIMWVFFMPTLAILSGVMIRLAMAYLQGKELALIDVGRVMVRTQPWLMFTAVLGTTSNGLLGGMGLASKIYFPRQIIPLNSVCTVLFDFSISSAAVVTLLVIARLSGGPILVTPYLLLVPVLLLLLLMMAMGLGLMFGSANLFFRDVKYIVQVLLQFGIFFTPVYWFVSDMGDFGRWMLLNPAAPIMEAMSASVLGHEVDGRIVAGLDPMLWPYLAYSAAVAIGIFLLGIRVFRKSEPMFAEVM